MTPRPFIIPIFVPHLGCPHRCVFCDQRAIAGASVTKPSPEWVDQRISTYLGYKSTSRGATEVAFYGGNFLGLSVTYRNALLNAVHPFIERGEIEGIRFSTRPDSISEDSLGSVTEFDVKVVEIGAQSMNDEVLAISRRGHVAQDTKEAVTRLKVRGIHAGIQVMPGLPGDTVSSIMETGRSVVDLKPEFVRIYPAVVVKGTVLEKWYQKGRFTPLSLEEAVDITKQLFDMFTKNNISVIRMGLHASDSLTASDTVVAGPFHPAFGHLVHGALFFDRAVALLEQQKGTLETVALKVNPRHVSRLKGDRGCNTEKLCRRFAIKKLQVVPDPSVPLGQVALDKGT